MLKAARQYARGILAQLLTVDGAGSGLDADLLRGGHPLFGDGSTGDLTVTSGQTVNIGSTA
ncbi:MAG TPA: hypothetical protein VGN72_04905, partial [Tepidisphaeraceae bacterium]|nr:hypothetical protein [Tepidisphaeraceae bacterium]